MRYFMDVGGNYLGGYEGAEPPAGAIEINSPPAHALDKYDFQTKQWIAYVAPKDKSYAEKLADVLVAKGVIADGEKP